MRKLSLSLLALMTVGIATAQQKDDEKKPATIAIHFGLQDFVTPQRIRSSSLQSVLSNKRWAKFREQDPTFGISYLKGLSPHFDVSANYFLGWVDYPFRDATPRTVAKKALHEMDASLHMKLLTDRHTLVPYLSAGIGGSAYGGGRFDAFLPLGAGLQLKLAPGTFLMTNFQYRVPVTERGNFHFLTTMGLAVNIGKPKAAAPVVVAPPPPPPAPPAPVDTDGDGVADNVDKCPTVKGLAKYQGCPIPDTDKDGINDEEDKCPSVAGIARYQGCPIPDTDKDGINDEEDKCPSVPGIARYQGCPIPDTDADGVNDEEDKCPTVAGIVANYGCPEIKFTPENITFGTGSATLTAKGVKELKENVLPAIKAIGSNPIQIQGHTDNTGSAKTNMSLSKRRADAVKAWLVKNGIPATQLTTAGFGADQPIADNKTNAGRLKNRRVDFKLVKD
ncbi:MAG: OmpA family protein [Bacteroidetes bacterium]|jgi:Outer membrane protein and related peptidoglycan-associated (lipo)proteins|uniref:OmpA family protein n=1 Tax=Phnomibacter sp. TaxID=2836217 RepID=UPI002FDDDED7|nr:OmpA family protein [Bacteroidota bacterium]